MKFLFKVAKLLPRLEAQNEAETIVTINAITRIMHAEELDWHQVGAMLSDFVTRVAGEDDTVVIPAPAAPPRPFFRPATGTPPPRQTSPTWSNPGPAQSPPKPPPINWTALAHGSIADQKHVIRELLLRGMLNGKAEKNEVNKMRFVLDTNLPISPQQVRKLAQFAMRL